MTIYWFRQHIFPYFVIICSWKRTNANSLTQEFFEPSLIEIGPLVLEKIFKFHPWIFPILLLYPLGKWCGSSFEQIRKMICAKFGRYWPFSYSKEDIFFNLVNVFYDTSLLSPHGKGHGHSFEQTWTPFTQGCFVFGLNCQVVLVITLIKREKNPLFNIWELNGSSFEQTWISYTQRCFVPNLVEIGLVVLKQKIFKFCQWILTIS